MIYPLSTKGYGLKLSCSAYIYAHCTYNILQSNNNVYVVNFEFINPIGYNNTLSESVIRIICKLPNK